jgi:hypothetical protein
VSVVVAVVVVGSAIKIIIVQQHREMTPGLFWLGMEGLTRSWSSCGSGLPGVLFRIASANSWNDRSILILFFADVSINFIPCSRAIYTKANKHEMKQGLNGYLFQRNVLN